MLFTLGGKEELTSSSRDDGGGDHAEGELRSSRTLMIRARLAGPNVR